MIASKLRLPLLALVALAFAVGAQPAAADSGSFTVADAGGGSMAVQATASVENCPGGPEFCVWYVTLQERHSSLPCRQDDVFLRGIKGDFEPKTINQTWTFRPFFPRAARLCLYLNRTGGSGPRLLDEELYIVPPGYGWHRSTEQWCEDFPNQAAAQYYWYLYPGDPSLLDLDGDGVACEWNDCPCGAEPIPPEPPPVPPAPVMIPAPPLPSAACLVAKGDESRAGKSVKAAQRALRNAWGPRGRARWRQSLKKRRAALRRAQARVLQNC